MKKLFPPLLLICLAPLLFGEIRGLEVKSITDQQINTGKQYLFIIAIDRYAEWSNLKNPVKDAQEIRDILQSKYRIDTVIELYNADATKANIIRKFSEMQTLLQPEDSLLIMYAGHGYYDRKTTNTAFWIPTNGGLDIYDQANWIPNSQIRGIIGRFIASHILLISDSCFSGDILNTMRGEELFDESNGPNAAKAYALTSRQVITSGSEEAVPDNSEFTLQLKMALLKNTDPYLDPIGLYSQIRRGVQTTLPLLGNLKDTGHQEGASFYLFLKPKPVTPPNPVPTPIPPAPAIPALPAAASTAEKSHAYSYLSLAAGPQLPVFDAAAYMDIGFGTAAALGYGFVIPSGFFGFSFDAGVVSGEVRELTSAGYTLYSIPVGASLGYELEFSPSFRARLGLGGGESINLLSFKSGYTPIIYTPFAYGIIGCELFLNPRLAFGISGRCAVQFFSNTMSISATPVITVKTVLP